MYELNCPYSNHSTSNLNVLYFLVTSAWWFSRGTVCWLLRDREGIEIRLQTSKLPCSTKALKKQELQYNNRTFKDFFFHSNSMCWFIWHIIPHYLIHVSFSILYFIKTISLFMIFLLPRLFRNPTILNFLSFPWDFEIARFDCSVQLSFYGAVSSTDPDQFPMFYWQKLAKVFFSREWKCKLQVRTCSLILWQSKS